jgi:hypothetical protein
MAKLMKQTEERHSESRMRAIRTSGSMRGRPRRSLAFAPLTPSGAPYSTERCSRSGDAVTAEANVATSVLEEVAVGCCPQANPNKSPKKELNLLKLFL